MSVNPNDAASIKSVFPGYQSWNDNASVVADFKATGGSGKGPSQSSTPSYSGAANTSGYGASDLISQAQQLQQFTVQSNQPAIQSYEAAKEPLKARYNSLLKSMAATQEMDVNRQTIATNAELARRGVTGGLGEQTMQNAISPLNQAYSAQIGGVGAQESSDIASINQAIALLKSGNPESALSGAQTLMNLQQNQQQFSANQQQQQSQFSQTLAQQQAESAQQNQQFLSEQQRLTSNANKSTQTEKGENTAQQLSNDLNRGITYHDAHVKYDATLGVAKVDQMYNAESIYGPSKETQKLTETPTNNASSTDTRPWYQKILGLY